MTAAGARGARRPLAFIGLTIAFSTPFLILGAASGRQLMPGLPMAALMAVCPGLAALALESAAGGTKAAVALLGRCLDAGRIAAKVWYGPTLLLAPTVGFLAFWVMRWSGVALPVPSIGALTALGLTAVFFVAAACEELGWSGYAAEPLQARLGALGASLVIGAACAVFHYLALLQVHRSVVWIAWWTLYTVAARILIVWIFNNTGRSVFAAALFHMTINLVWQMFPVRGSFFDPRVFGLLIAAFAALTVVIWGPRTLAGRMDGRLLAARP